ncbi:hypothetical protein HYU14_00255 [Candidatus Woesearchaeota archaeon]|nr:hypothetical protein [Candidatus Woesearchaeota archaeon]
MGDKPGNDMYRLMQQAAFQTLFGVYTDSPAFLEQEGHEPMEHSLDERMCNTSFSGEKPAPFVVNDNSYPWAEYEAAVKKDSPFLPDDPTPKQIITAFDIMRSSFSLIFGLEYALLVLNGRKESRPSELWPLEHTILGIAPLKRDSIIYGNPNSDTGFSLQVYAKIDGPKDGPRTRADMFKAMVEGRVNDVYVDIFQMSRNDFSAKLAQLMGRQHNFVPLESSSASDEENKAQGGRGDWYRDVASPENYQPDEIGNIRLHRFATTHPDGVVYFQNMMAAQVNPDLLPDLANALITPDAGRGFNVLSADSLRLGLLLGKFLTDDTLFNPFAHIEGEIAEMKTRFRNLQGFSQSAYKPGARLLE